jgi:pilus assembly protein CpaF
MDDNTNSNVTDKSQLRRDADKGREPQFVSAQIGRRQYSIGALIEKIEAAFIEEYGQDSSVIRQADTPAKRLKLIGETANYVFAVESVQLAANEKAAIIERAYSQLFGYGPLDPLFLDHHVTTISLEGADRAAVRYGQGELTSLGPVFANADHFQRIVKRLLIQAGAELRADHPYMEVGLMAGDRPICVNLVAPPVTHQLTVDIRVHPKVLPNWDDLVAAGFMSQQAAELLKALIDSPHGLLVIGEPESGKTMLLNLLVNTLPNTGKVVTVERAGEMRLPDNIQRLQTVWPLGDQPGITFGEQIVNALAQNPRCIVLDEVRSDEPQTIAPLLTMPDAPRQIWSFRSNIFAKRLQSALGMLARRADIGSGETLVKALYEHLPFVIAVNRVGERLQLWSISEWQFKHSPDYPTYTPLLQTENGELKLTGERPSHLLNLLESFWS